MFDSVVQAFVDAEAYRESVEIYEEKLETYEEELKKLSEEEEEAADEEASGEEASDDDAATDNGEDAKDEEPEGPEKPARPAPDPAADVLLRAIDREIPVRFHATRAGDITNALEIAERFNLRVVIVDGEEAHFVADDLAEAEASVVLNPWPATSETPTRTAPAGVLSSGGVRWTVASHFAGAAPSLFDAAALAAAGAEAGPVDLLTSRAAAILGADAMGRLAPGRPADMVVWSSNPLEPGAYVEAVYVGGEKVYDRIDDPAFANGADQ